MVREKGGQGKWVVRGKGWSGKRVVSENTHKTNHHKHTHTQCVLIRLEQLFLKNGSCPKPKSVQTSIWRKSPLNQCILKVHLPSVCLDSLKVRKRKAPAGGKILWCFKGFLQCGVGDGVHAPPCGAVILACLVHVYAT